MAYLSTKTLLKQTGIDRQTLYSLIRRGVIVPPSKQNGRYMWKDAHVEAISKVIAAEGQKKQGTFALQEKRYYGNKAKYASFIRRIADEFLPSAQGFADYFAGAGTVAEAFADKELLTNDMLYSAYLFLQAWFAPIPCDLDKLAVKINEYNTAAGAAPNYVSQNFAGTYFSEENAIKIGYIREDIEQLYVAGELNERERAALICSLLHAMDAVANIYAHYDTFKKMPPSSAPLYLLMPNIPAENKKANRAIWADANMIGPYTYADIAYLDPPMDSRQYGTMYHLLENIARWEKPKLEGVAAKPQKAYERSAYCLREAEASYANLLKGLRAEIIIATYPRKLIDKSTRSAPKISPQKTIELLQNKGQCVVRFPSLKKQKVAGKQLVLGEQFLPVHQKIRTMTSGGVIVCDTKKQTGAYVPSALNFIGGKYKQLDEILVYLPQNIDVFYDIFAGGFTVGLNAPGKKTVFIDEDSYVMGLFQALNDFGYDAFVKEAVALIEQYGLSMTYTHGYEQYGVPSDEGLASINRIAYTRLRESFNAKKNKDITYWVMFYILIVYGYNNTPRFNRLGEFNSPVGKRDFNASTAQKLASFAEKLGQKNAAIHVQDFRTMDIGKIKVGDFVFLDPPYLGASTYYNDNKGWEKQDEEALFAFLDRLELSGIRFMLYTVLSYQNKPNEMLLRWLFKEDGNVRVIHCKEEEAAQPILVINY